MANEQNLDLELLLREQSRKEKGATQKSILIAGMIVLFCFTWLVFTYWQVQSLRSQQTAITKEISSQKDSLTVIKHLRDSFRIQYLEAKGFDKSKPDELLDESIRANNLLALILERYNPDTTIKIKYYRKSLDQEKVWVALKEIGYRNIQEATSVNPVLLNAETNSLAFGSEVPLTDIKIISLTLIRAGFKVQHLFRSFRHPGEKKLVQIIRAAPSNGSEDRTPPISVEKISKIADIEGLIIDHL